jgi:hypothetical protein
VRYFDHHFAEHVPIHSNLELHLDADPQTCTSLLMDGFLGGRFHAWALVGAYAPAGFDAERRDTPRRLGAAINYNAQGDDLQNVRVARTRC